MKKKKLVYALTKKLDGVGPVDNRPSTDKLPPKLQNIINPNRES